MLEMAGIFGALLVGLGAMGGLFDFGSSNDESDSKSDSNSDQNDLLEEENEAQDYLDELIQTSSTGDPYLTYDKIADDPDPSDPVSDTTTGDITGTDGREILFGDEGGNYIEGGDGIDTIHGGAGDDTLLGEAGDDILNGEDGNDTLIGGQGDDTVSGQDGDDILYGGDGIDKLAGSKGNDFADGGAGNDFVDGGAGNDLLIGGAGVDILQGGFGDDILDGRVLGDDGLDQDEQDYLNGGFGNDTVIAGAADIVTLGDGADAVVLGEWIGSAPENLIEVTDFSAAEDNIVISYEPIINEDGTISDAPEVDVEADESDASRYYVRIDGVRVAAITSDVVVDASSLEVVPTTIPPTAPTPEIAQLLA